MSQKNKGDLSAEIILDSWFFITAVNEQNYVEPVDKKLRRCISNWLWQVTRINNRMPKIMLIRQTTWRPVKRLLNKTKTRLSSPTLWRMMMMMMKQNKPTVCYRSSTFIATWSLYLSESTALYKENCRDVMVVFALHINWSFWMVSSLVYHIIL